MTWSEEFVTRSRIREQNPDPDWRAGSRLPSPVIRSLQRFQVGESGDGAALIRLAEATGDPDYAAAVRMFVAEEQNHARMLAELLRAAGAPTIAGHWSDRVFVATRRALGLRSELLVLATAELIALEYYGALAASSDPLLREVSSRILDDERHHVRFQERRLREAFAPAPRWARRPAGGAWQTFATVVIAVVALDHGPALRAIGTTRRDFYTRCRRLMTDFRVAVFDGAGPR